jgi:hypothetical protein
MLYKSVVLDYCLSLLDSQYKGPRGVSVYDMPVVLVATHQHVMTDKWTNVMILEDG